MSYRQSAFIVLLGISLSSCIGGGVGGSSGGAADFKRVTSPHDCKQAKADAQNIIIQWAKDRQSEGKPVSSNSAAALLDLARFESGGARGMSFANITSHGNESHSNSAGNNGVVKANSNQVEKFLDNNKASHETNFGALQISPNVIINYGKSGYVTNFINSAGSPSDLFNRCISGLAYNDSANVMSELSTLWQQRASAGAKLKALGKYNGGKKYDQSRCRGDSACNEAAEYFGRWLTYCPRMNLDLALSVFESKNRFAYFGALRKTGRNPGICKDMIAQELKASPNLVLEPSQKAHTGPNI